MKKEDRNFDNIAQKFAQNIYASDKGFLRQDILWEDLEKILRHFSSKQKLHVLDAGGGLAQLSQKLARNDHDITLCDVSEQMLALAKQAIAEHKLLDKYKFIHSKVQNLTTDVVKKADIVLFHAVMEWLAEPKDSLIKLLSKMSVGSIVSVMFYNHHALVYKNVVCGNIPHILNGMPHKKRFKLQPERGLKPEEVYKWIIDANFVILGRSGIRSFSDYIGNFVNIGNYEFADVLALEKQLCRQEPYLSLGRYIHVWAKKLK